MAELATQLRGETCCLTVWWKLELECVWRSFLLECKAEVVVSARIGGFCFSTHRGLLSEFISDLLFELASELID